MAGIGSIIKVSTIWASTTAFPGSTGDSAGTTAGSSGGDSSSLGGLPFCSTGIDMSGFDGALFIATVSGTTTAVLKVVTSPSSTTSTTGWTDLAATYVQGEASTVAQTLVADVYKPLHRFLAAIVQVATTSGGPEAVSVVQYSANKQGTSNSTAYLVSGTLIKASPTT